MFVGCFNQIAIFTQQLHVGIFPDSMNHEWVNQSTALNVFIVYRYEHVFIDYILYTPILHASAQTPMLNEFQ